LPSQEAPCAASPQWPRSARETLACSISHQDHSCTK